MQGKANLPPKGLRALQFDRQFLSRITSKAMKHTFKSGNQKTKNAFTLKNRCIYLRNGAFTFSHYIFLSSHYAVFYHLQKYFEAYSLLQNGGGMFYGIIRRMERTTKEAILQSLPFVVWMGLMFLLPATAESYAIRSAATLAAGIACWMTYRKDRSFRAPAGNSGAKSALASCSTGLLAGLAVFALWIWAPAWPYSEPAAPADLPYAPQTCGWFLTIAKLAGSAFVIAPAEEMFFRSFLYRRLIARDFASVPLSRFDLSAFMWVVFLFTLEHDRPLAAAATGAIYGLLAIRFGISSAIIAHVTTNFVLGLHVIFNNAWRFW